MPDNSKILLLRQYRKNIQTKWNQVAANFLIFYNEWPIYEIKIVIDNMKTKILLTGMAKRSRINIQISIKIIIAKIETRSWPKLDRNALFFQYCHNWWVISVCWTQQYLVNTSKTRIKYYFTIFCFLFSPLCLMGIMSSKPVFLESINSGLWLISRGYISK